MKWFKQLFSKPAQPIGNTKTMSMQEMYQILGTPAEVNDRPRKYMDCEVEFLPITERYYPKYKGEYLLWCSTSGVYRRWSMIEMATYCQSVDEAKKILDKFLETRGIGSVKISAKELEAHGTN